MRRRNSPFRLPITATFSLHRTGSGRHIAHALDFDLVCVSDTEQKALDKLRLAVRTYIEYGLNNNLAADILFPAPDEYWEKLQGQKIVTLLAPIEIEDNRLFVFSASDDNGSQQTARTA